VDIDALAVGHDLTRGTAAFRRAAKGEPRLTERQGNGGAERDPWEGAQVQGAEVAKVLDPVL
jgi:single-strand DNA-binding protein